MLLCTYNHHSGFIRQVRCSVRSRPVNMNMLSVTENQFMDYWALDNPKLESLVERIEGAFTKSAGGKGGTRKADMTLR